MVNRHSLVGAALLLACVMIAPPVEGQTVVGPAYVTRVVDGDTLYVELGGRLEVVRYLGINTPRVEHPLYGTRPYALLAREANRRLVEGKWVNLVFEGPVRDRYDRLLAYVWVRDLFVNAALLHRGYAETASASTAGYGAYFRELEEGASRDGRGLWGDGTTRLYHRPRPTEQVADEQDETAGTTSGGRVFSAPMPFLPPMPTTSSSVAPSSAPSVGPPASSAPRRGVGSSPSYAVPSAPMRSR
jgi:endonuclease YncB( thermonuclease family)